MKKITTIVVAILFAAPMLVSAQSITVSEIDGLLNQDIGQLISLNGEQAVRDYLVQLLFILTQLSNDSFYEYDNGNNNNDDVEAETFSARDIERNEAELRGEIDMNDFRNGIVFFVYGEDEDDVDDVDREDSYNDVDERGDNLQKVRVDTDLDDKEDYERTVRNLDADTRHYFRICVEYEDDDNGERLECGDVEDFETDDRNGSSNNDDEPDAQTLSARDIRDDEAELRGEVDMNDFRDGIVFFVYGEDEDEVEDALREDTYNDIDERGDDLQKIRVDSDLDGQQDYERTVTNLDDDTRYYYAICVEYEDEDDDETLECGSVEEFRTDN